MPGVKFWWIENMMTNIVSVWNPWLAICMAGKPFFCVNKTMIIVGKEDFFWFTRPQKFEQHFQYLIPELKRTLKIALISTECSVIFIHKYKMEIIFIVILPGKLDIRLIRSSYRRFWIESRCVQIFIHNQISINLHIFSDERIQITHCRFKNGVVLFQYICLSPLRSCQPRFIYFAPLYHISSRRKLMQLILSSFMVSGQIDKDNTTLPWCHEISMHIY